VADAGPATDVSPDEVGLCLSGGGYGAMLFHVGVLWRLNEMGWLPRLTRISSVSRDSITAGVIARAMAQSRLRCRRHRHEFQVTGR